MVRIYGASDDLIEIEGSISEEFNYYPSEAEPAYLSFSEGSIFRVVFDHDSIWRFTPVSRGKARMVLTICTADPAADEYSDVVELHDEELDEPIRWAVLGEQMAWVSR